MNIELYNIDSLFCQQILTEKLLKATVNLKVYLENINLILAFIINIISQPIEHLDISSAFIVRLIRKCTWYFLTQ